CYADGQRPRPNGHRLIAACPREQVETGLYIRQHPCCSLRQRDGALGSLEQPQAKKFFKGAYLLADGAGCHVQLFGSLAETELTSDSLESPQRAQRRQWLGHANMLVKLNSVVNG